MARGAVLIRYLMKRYHAVWGEKLLRQGRLADNAVERAIDALTRFRAIADRIGAKNIHVIATAAAREAENGPDFINWAEGICGTSINVLSGRGEAEMAANGVMAGMHNAEGLAGDMGGGSLELIDISDGRLVGGKTLPLGSLRLMDVTKGDMDVARDFIDENLDRVEWLDKGNDRPFYSVGGTWRALARLYMKQYDYPLHVMHNFIISADEAHRFADYVIYKCRKSPETLIGFDELSKVRQNTVPYGALLMERIIRKIEPSSIVTSAFGVREGFLFSLLQPEEREKDPLIAACEYLADLRARSPIHARELCEWTDQLFTENGPAENEEEKRLRYAACLLSDIGWRSHPDYRGTQTLDFVAYGSFSGIDHEGRAFLALTQFYRHAGVKEEPDAAFMILINKKMLEKARVVGAAIRVAAMISAALPGLKEMSSIHYDDEGHLVLSLTIQHSVLEGERLQKRLSALAKLVGRDPVIRIAEEEKQS